MYLNGKRFISSGQNNQNNSFLRNFFLLLSLLLLFFSNAANSAVINHSGQILVNETWSDASYHVIQASVSSPLLVISSVLLTESSDGSTSVSDKVNTFQVVSVIRLSAVIEITHNLYETSQLETFLRGSISEKEGEMIFQGFDLGRFEKGVVTC